MTTLRTKALAITALGALALSPVVALAAATGAQGGQGVAHASTSTPRGSASASSTDEVASSTESQGKGPRAASSTASTTWVRGEGASGSRNDTGEARRSDIANIVHELLATASADAGIGQELRSIASSQASSSLDASEAVVTLDAESGWKVFLLGPDYKSLGALRSSLVTTENSITRLERAKGRATSPATVESLDTQIAALKDVASSTQAYIASHSGGFSLFGWLVRLVGI